MGFFKTNPAAFAYGLLAVRNEESPKNVLAARGMKILGQTVANTAIKSPMTCKARFVIG
jgi:hypothetical protein